MASTDRPTDGQTDRLTEMKDLNFRNLHSLKHEINSEKLSGRRHMKGHTKNIYIEEELYILNIVRL